MHSDFEKCAVVCYFSDSNEPSAQDVNLSTPTGKGKEDHLLEPLQESPDKKINSVLAETRTLRQPGIKGRAAVLE